MCITVTQHHIRRPWSYHTHFSVSTRQIAEIWSQWAWWDVFPRCFVPVITSWIHVRDNCSYFKSYYFSLACLVGLEINLVKNLKDPNIPLCNKHWTMCHEVEFFLGYIATKIKAKQRQVSGFWFAIQSYWKWPIFVPEANVLRFIHHVENKSFLKWCFIVPPLPWMY